MSKKNHGSVAGGWRVTGGLFLLVLFGCLGENASGLKGSPAGLETCREERKNTACSALHDPVCGKDGKTYSNRCYAWVACVDVSRQGECGK